ncbi:MAG: hypothetical protein ACRCSX_11075 [Allorhizobium sp.]
MSFVEFMEISAAGARVACLRTGKPAQNSDLYLGLHYFAAQHEKSLDKITVSFQIFSSKPREGVPGKLFAGV